MPDERPVLSSSSGRLPPEFHSLGMAVVCSIGHGYEKMVEGIWDKTTYSSHIADPVHTQGTEDQRREDKCKVVAVWAQEKQ